MISSKTIEGKLKTSSRCSAWKPFLFSFFFLALLIVPLVSAAPPVLSTVQAGSLEILAPSYNFVTQGLDKDIYWHVFNTSTLLTNKTASCYYHLYSQQKKGEHIVTVNNVKTFSNGRDFEVEVAGANFSTIGEYCHLIECNTSTQTGGLERCFTVISTTSTENNTTTFLILGISAVVLLLIAFILKNEFISFIAGLLFTIFGMYTMLYGFNNVTDFYTRSMALVSLGVGFILIFLSAFSVYESSNDNNEED